MTNGSTLQLLNAPRRYPATAVILMAAVVMYAAFTQYKPADPSLAENPRVALGAVSSVSVVRELQRRRAVEPDKKADLLPSKDFAAPLHLWNGEWWRVFVSGFHHAGPVHLISNCLALMMFGYILERRVGSLRYLVFFLVATTVSLIPCFVMTFDTVGLSGGISAVFGLMIVVRDHDDELKRLLPLHVFIVGILALFAGFLLNELGVMKVSNLAHFSGLIYGWLAGWACYADSPARRFGRWVFIAGNLLIGPALYLTAHPFWNADYHRALAWQTDDGERRIEHLQESVRRNPMSLATWHDLAHVHLRRGENMEAWRAAVAGFYHNRSNLNHFQFAAQIARRFRTQDERETAISVFREVFGSEAAAWDEHIGISAALGRSRRRPVVSNRFPPGSGSRDGPRPRRWIVVPGGVDLFWNRIDGAMTLQGRRWKTPEVDPDDSRSALLGRPL